MLDQSFSADNFRRIFDLKNREGQYLERRFFPHLMNLTRSLKSIATEFRALKIRRSARQITLEQYDQDKIRLNREKSTIKDEKEAQLNRELEQIAGTLARSDFQFSFTPAILPGRKSGFVASKQDPATYFCMAQLQHNLRSLFKVRQGNRHWIVSQAKNILYDRFPKIVIRTDISDFYESVGRDRILKAVQAHTLVSETSKRFVRNLLAVCPGVGLPRGVGVSAVLSEIALRDLDRRIQDMGDVIYYGRYVDDIIVVFAKGHSVTANSKQSQLFQMIRQQHFEPNISKTTSLELPSPTSPQEMNFLGYRFCWDANGLHVRLSLRRSDRYRRKVARAFALYRADAKHSEKEARKVLINRIQFLTINTRLVNNKRNVFIGPYFSNTHISRLDDLASLDNYLQSINSRSGNQATRRRISQLSFEKGFTERRFIQFTPHQLTEIERGWLA